jgi:hypothetical protein
VIAVFWPDLRVEIAGVALIVLILGLNWWGSRPTTRRPQPL